MSYKPLIIETLKSVRKIVVSLKYKRFTPSGCKDIGIRKFKFVADTRLKPSLFSVRVLQISTKHTVILTELDSNPFSKIFYYL